MSDLVIDLFAGPGGWSEAARSLGILEVGIELDAAACRTRAAAGHRTIRADVAEFDPAPLAGKTWGIVGSPPCTTFSAAGDQAGNRLLDLTSNLIRSMFLGSDTRAAHREAMALELARSQWRADLPADVRAVKVAAAVASAALVTEPARFIHAARPEWVALEQVPAVLPLWQVYAAELRRTGYHAWAGTLNSADFGVPQTRVRAILIASRVRRVSRPEPTHYDPRKGAQLWGEPWVTMAAALGWGADGRPSVAVTAGGTSTGGAEPFGNRGRAALEAERDAGRWTLRTSFGTPWTGPKASGTGSHGTHEMDPGTRPAHAVTTKARSWALHRSRGASVDRRNHPLDESAPTITGAGGKAGGNLSWVAERGERPLLEQDSVRISTAEAAILQSFPAGYPWQGTRTAQYTQIGNAIPPLLAEHVLSMATGIRRQQRPAEDDAA